MRVREREKERMRLTELEREKARNKDLEIKEQGTRNYYFFTSYLLLSCCLIWQTETETFTDRGGKRG